MRNIIDLYEASLLGDIEDTMKSGDKINDQFEKIKSIITDPNAYRKINRHSNMRLDIRNIDDILSLVGLNKQTGLLVSIDKRSEPDGWNGWTSFWYFNILIMGGKDIEFKESAKGLSFPKFLQKYVAPHFKDFNSFVEFIKERKLR